MMAKKDQILGDLQEWGYSLDVIPESWSDLQNFYSSAKAERDQLEQEQAEAAVESGQVAVPDADMGELDDSGAEQPEVDGEAEVEGDGVTVEASESIEDDDALLASDEDGDCLAELVVKVGCHFCVLDDLELDGRRYAAGSEVKFTKVGARFCAGPKTAEYLLHHRVAGRG